MLTTKQKNSLRKSFVTVFAVFLILVIGTRIPPIRAAFYVIAKPAMIVASDLGRSLGTSLAKRKDTAQAILDRERYRALVEELAAKSADRVRLIAENEELKSLLKYQTERLPNARAASVLAYDAKTSAKLLLIDRGSAKGCKEGDAVLSPSGIFLGTLTQVEQGTSSVRLLRDQHSKVAAMVTLSDGLSEGIVMPVEGGAIALRYLGENIKIPQNALVLTSRLNERVPAELPIGVVVSSIRENDAPFQRALIDTVTRIESLHFVMTLCNEANETPKE